MFDSPNDLLRHHKRISLVTEHKDTEPDEELSLSEYADYVLARATARMLLDHGIEHDAFMDAMSDELVHRGQIDDD